MSCSTVVDLDTSISTDRSTLGKGRMVFTGPQGVSDHRMTVQADEGVYTGEVAETPEKTSDLEYLLRAPEGHLPARKSQSIPFGSIGWGVPTKQDFRVQHTGNQIMVEEAGPFRQRNEDRHTHRLQEPYYAPPKQQQQQQSAASARAESAKRPATGSTARTASRPSTASTAATASTASTSGF